MRAGADSLRRYARVAGALAVVLAAAAAPARGDGQPSDAVFLLQVVEHRNGAYQPSVFGSAFFISEEGLALTNSHVVYLARRHPERYSLLAVVGREFYSASVVCASRLRDDPTAPALNVPAGRDIAKILLQPSAFPFGLWRVARVNGPGLLVAAAHRGPLPRFRGLVAAAAPVSGSEVHVVGYQHLLPGQARWAATGQVVSVDRTPDGTEIFGIRFSGLPPAGDSGAPVLNASEHLVGMWTWHAVTDANLAMAISSTSFRLPCL